MNNNRNNRRRGRGNRNQGGGAGNQLNRIDSRARGNAPQLLDKYKKLAQDAQHNGDRVQAEYYLQFADHYHRVIADNKARQEEQRAKRNEDRDQSGDDNEDDGEDRRRPRRGRNQRDENRDSNRDNGRDNSRDNGRDNRQDNNRGNDQNEGDRGVEGEPIEARDAKPEADEGAKPRRARSERQPRRKPREDKNGATNSAADAGEIDMAALPPAIGADSEPADAKPALKLKPRRSRKPKDDDAGGDDDGLSAAG